MFSFIFKNNPMQKNYSISLSDVHKLTLKRITFKIHFQTPDFLHLNERILTQTPSQRSNLVLKEAQLNCQEVFVATFCNFCFFEFLYTFL